MSNFWAASYKNNHLTVNGNVKRLPRKMKKWVSMLLSQPGGDRVVVLSLNFYKDIENKSE